MHDADPHHPPPPLSAVLLGRCPRCGGGRLFSGFLDTAPRCETCGLDLSFADSADGPAFFVMFATGILVVAAALVVELSYRPPYWVHGVLWLPAIVILCLGLLRPVKALMISIQYRCDAREGRLHGKDGA